MFAEGGPTLKVRSLMTETPFCCLKTDTIQHAAELMKKRDVGAIPVITNDEDRSFIGVITDRDVCLYVAGQ